MNDLVKTLQSHHHTQTCREKKSVICRFNVPWPVTNETENVSKSKISKSKTVVGKVLSQAVKIDDLGKVTEKELLNIAGVSEAEYHEALENAEKTTVLYNRRPCKMNKVLTIQLSKNC